MQTKPTTIMPAADEEAQLVVDLAAVLTWRQQHHWMCDCEPCWEFDAALGRAMSWMEVEPRATVRSWWADSDGQAEIATLQPVAQ